MQGADLSDTLGLTTAQLETVVGVAKTKLPYGLFLPGQRWEVRSYQR